MQTRPASRVAAAATCDVKAFLRIRRLDLLPAALFARFALCIREPSVHGHVGLARLRDGYDVLWIWGDRSRAAVVAAAGGEEVGAGAGEAVARAVVTCSTLLSLVVSTRLGFDTYIVKPWEKGNTPGSEL